MEFIRWSRPWNVATGAGKVLTVLWSITGKGGRRATGRRDCAARHVSSGEILTSRNEREGSI